MKSESNVIEAGGRFPLGRLDRRVYLAADAADDATAALLTVCDLLTAAGDSHGTVAREYRAVAELALELRPSLPGGLRPAA